MEVAGLGALTAVHAGFELKGGIATYLGHELACCLARVRRFARLEDRLCALDDGIRCHGHGRLGIAIVYFLPYFPVSVALAMALPFTM